MTIRGVGRNLELKPFAFSVLGNSLILDEPCAVPLSIFHPRTASGNSDLKDELVVATTLLPPSKSLSLA